MDEQVKYKRDCGYEGLLFGSMTKLLIYIGNIKRKKFYWGA